MWYFRIALNSDAGRMAVPAWNMLSAFFYSPHVGLTSYFCEYFCGPPLGYGPYLHPWLLATTICWYRYCSPQHILRSPLQELWLLCNLITWQNSDAGRMAVPAWNMLSAFFYSPHVGLTSYFCELDINPYFLAITAERLENKYKTNNNMLRSI